MKRGVATYLMMVMAALINISAVACLSFFFFPVSQAFATYADHQPKRFSKPVPALKAEIDASIELMRRNGIYQAVGGDPLLLAIAFHESGGQLGAINPKGVAYCAFQIYYTNFKAMASQNNMSEGQFKEQILRDPQLCAAMGRQVLNYMIGRYGRDKGICRYLGQITELNETGTCAGLKEINLAMDVIGGGGIGDTNRDIESPNYSRQEIRGPNSGTQSYLNCQEDSFNFGRALALATQAGRDQKDAVAEEQYYKELYEETLGGEEGLPMHRKGFHNLRGEVRTTYCIGLVYDYMRLVRLLLPIDAYLASAFLEMVLETLLEYLCEFVATSVNNWLGKICLPTVKLFEALTIDGGFETGKGCDGASLADLLAVSSNASMMAVPSGSGGKPLPPVDSLPMQAPDGPGLGFRMRLPNGQTGTQ
ncbi:MAG: hypothetical protein EOM37_08080 [Proteobacteria bacterium]|nr:transglycosylase SLT domain-containing protein [Alphaproteobacteria bacterium]NCC03984.1 hypothetical protein [Pseudomonadota bacterium]